MSDILLVHGSCHGAWCWRDLIPQLTELGHSPRAMDLPGHGEDHTNLAQVTLDAYAEAILQASTPQTVLVGHSMGGFGITAAAQKNPAAMARLIYLCAYVPAPGLSLAEMRKRGPRQPLLPAVRMATDGISFTIDPELAPGIFYHDCPREAVDYALARLGPQPVAPTAVALDDVSRAAALPRHYIRCMDDRTIPPEYQCTMSADWPERDVSEMNCGHSPFFADPARLAALIDRAVSG